MTPEGKVKEAVKKVLKKHCIWYFMPSANGYGKVGIPDIIACWEGRFFAIETKAPGKIDNTTPNQDMQLAAIRSAGGWALVVDNATQVEEFINARLQERVSGVPQ
jgi:hypothetical protein